MKRGNLIVSRKPEETIVVGKGADQIIITVYRCDQGRVRIGVNAPVDVVIRRGELKETVA